MRYLRKIASFIILVILIAAVVIGCCVVFSVKNVNVTLLSYSDSAEDEIPQIKKTVLAQYRGTIMTFVNESEVASCLDDGRFVVDECVKEYPCTLNLIVRERMEIYCAASGDGYEIYDEDGITVRRATDEDGAKNSFDGAPNIILEGVLSKNDVSAAARAGAVFKSEFKSLRAVTSAIILKRGQSSIEQDKLTFVLTCGLKIEVQDFENNTEEKLSAAYRQFGNLSGDKKTCGTVYCFTTADGITRATYSVQ